MASAVRVDVNHEILVWARKTRGFELEEAASRIGVAPERLAAWEDGRERPTARQLRTIAKHYVRPICTFFLPQFPTGDEPGIKDFRRMHAAAVATDLSAELAVEIRLARERRTEALELVRDAGIDVPTFAIAASLEEDREELAARVRGALGVSLEEQASWANQHEAFGAWRSALEARGVLVFQTGRSSQQFVEPSEARGFSISGDELPVVVTNGRDAVTARCFTLLHELTHLALRNAGLCDLHEFGTGSEFDRVEAFCNHVAGAILVPRGALLQTSIVRDHGTSERWEDGELAQIARRFWVSSEVALRRLLLTRRTTAEFYTAWRAEHDDRVLERPQPKGEVKLPMSTRVIRRNGRFFPRLVFGALREGRLSYHRASTYLGAGAHHLPAIERAIFDHRGGS